MLVIRALDISLGQTLLFTHTPWSTGDDMQESRQFQREVQAGFLVSVCQQSFNQTNCKVDLKITRWKNHWTQRHTTGTSDNIQQKHVLILGQSTPKVPKVTFKCHLKKKLGHLSANFSKLIGNPTWHCSNNKTSLYGSSECPLTNPCLKWHHLPYSLKCQ